MATDSLLDGFMKPSESRISETSPRAGSAYVVKLGCFISSSNRAFSKIFRDNSNSIRGLHLMYILI